MNQLPKAIFDRTCRDCPRLAQFLDESQKKFPDYYCAPVPPFGDATPKLLIVGLAPGLHGANATGRPFTGDHAGLILYRTLHRFGFATRPESIHARDGLQLLGARITNAVKCVPPENKPLPAEIKNCNRYLKAELATLPPETVLLALGRIAHDAILLAMGLKLKLYTFAHGAQFALPSGHTLIDSYHCSRYNTQTGKLTQEMFDRVFAQVRRVLQGG
jgi:uracil-DNA glycosylase family 4